MNLFAEHTALHNSSKNDMMATPPLLLPGNSYHTPQAEIIHKGKPSPCPWVLSFVHAMLCGQYLLCMQIAPLDDSYIASRQR